MDNLFSAISSDGASDLVSMSPGYLLAADNHNIGNSLDVTKSWLDPQKYIDGGDAAWKFIATAALSGADSMYNSAVTVGNIFGAEAKLSNTGAWVSSLDADLGKYYDSNREIVDLAGFVGTSFIPGMAGIKVLNAGQLAIKGAKGTGFLGANLSRATGLLVPETEMYVQLAANKVIQSHATFASINVNTVKALASGVWQNTLEAAAFETAVQSTMFKSPILEHETGWDIAKNIAFGGLVGGSIGGAFEAARTFGSIRKAVNAENPTAKTFSSRALIAENTPASQKIIQMAEDRDFTAMPISVKNAAGEETTNFATNQKLYESKVQRINNDIRSETNAMATSGDTQITNTLADITYGMSHNDLFPLFIHAKDIGRMSSQLAVETAAKKAVKNLDEMKLAGLTVKYVKLTGSEVGSILDAAPKVLNIADVIKVGAKDDPVRGVLDYVRGEKFKPGDEWNASKMTGVDDHLTAEARYIYTDHLMKSEIKEGAKVQYDDFPMLEKALHDKQFNIKVVHSDNSVSIISAESDLIKHIVTSKPQVAATLMERLAKSAKSEAELEEGTAAVAKIVNMRKSALEGSPNPANLDDFFARQAANETHKKALVDRGARNANEPITNIEFMPTIAKIGYEVPEELLRADGNVVNGMVWLKTQQKLFQDAADNVAARWMGPEIYGNATPISDSVLHGASQIGQSGGLWSFANGAYGSIGSFVQNIGANVTRPLKFKLRQETSDVFTSPLVQLGNKQPAAIEFEVLNQRAAGTSEQYVLDVNGYSGQPFALIAKKVADYRAALEAGVKDATMKPLQEGAAEFFPITHPETYAAIEAHIQRLDTRLQATKEIRAAQGHPDESTMGIFTPVRPNPNDHPFVAFVKDTRVTGAGHTSMIHAASEEKLQELIAKVPSEYKVYLKGEAEDFYRARNEYEYARTLNTNYIDHDLKNRGINSQLFPKTDPQKIVDSILQEHLRADDVLAAELVRLKYQPQFDWLADQGSQYSKIESSRYGNALQNAEKYGKNPYTDLTKTALDISRASEYPLLYSFNKSLDTAVSKVVGHIKDVWNGARTPADLEGINTALKDAGYNNAYPDAATVLLANHTAPKAELSKFIRTSNSILSFFTLGSDPLNGIVNAVGANVLRFPEINSILRGIRTNNPELSGALSNLHINLPGTNDPILSPMKMMANATKAFFSDEFESLNAQFIKNGTVKDGLQQFKSIQDDFTLRGTESVSDLNGRLNSAWQKAQELSGKVAAAGRKYSGNDFFENYNRFVSSHVMKQFTDLGEAAGLLTPAESVAYINSFVNKVEGNTIASQRPVVFQGPVGQAIGLFQSYQFNLMQQLFRHVGEGTGKDAAMLLGLQSTLFGINGAPGFNFINQHIIGNLSGNTQHRDLYDAVYGAAGQQAGDFLMYGIPSSIIKTNLYSRGDINPRQITIIPNSLSQVPIVGAYGKLLSTMKDTVERIGVGGNVWENILQGIEHNGISRPLAGLAQVAQAAGPNGMVYSTSTKGSILTSNDLMSLATLSRLAGGRPLDEAIVNDGTYRIAAYELARKAERATLDEAIKSSTIAGNTPSESQVTQFAAAYAATGGKQAQFNMHMMKEMTAANTSRAEKIRTQLSNPMSIKMQLLMDGRNTNATGYASPDSME